MDKRRAILRLKDGKEFEGTAFGAPISLNTGEAVFNTGIPGYQEILTDPSYNGQLVTLTSPMIGNYGTSANDNESDSIKATALIIRHLYRGPVPEGRTRLEDFLMSQGVPGLEDVDTRTLTLHLRDHGSQNAILFYPEDREEAEAKLASFPDITGRDLIEGVAVKTRTFNPDLGPGFEKAPQNPSKLICLVDFGIKRNIISCFYKRGAAVVLLPPDATAVDVLTERPDALFLSNGPGDPALLQGAVAMTRALIGKLPVQGICLGHQIITLALGGRTEKMKFGHHGSNQPVKNLCTGSTFVTAQNHGFMASPGSLPEGTEIWFTNANDGSIEGIYNEKLNVRSVQFHPEASPGPEEAEAIFDTFIEKAAK